MAKYIDAEPLRKEIEKRMHICDGVFERDSDTYYQGKAVAYQETLSFLDSLQQEQPCDTCTNDKGCVTCKDGELWEGKEQPCGGYDEAYLNEKIAKASKTWEGVDVDKYMAEMRGYEQPSEDLEEEIKRYEANLPESATVDPFEDYPTLKNVARHFVNWQKEQMIRNCSVQASYEAEIEKAEKDLGWHSVDECLPPIDEEVIVLTDIITKDGLKVGFGRICFGHRPNPEGWDGKDIFTGKVTHHDVVTYDGWNIPGVKYWMHCPELEELK